MDRRGAGDDASLECEEFRLPPPDLSLGGEDVHVWSAWLEQPAARAHQLAGLLSADERGRAQRFRGELDRERFIAGRGVLRAILGRYLDADPKDLEFRYGPSGKPCLAGNLEAAGLHFNVSHSAAVAVYAVARGREVGVDVERLRAIPDAERIAARFFSEQERAALRAILPGDRTSAFYRCWTRKEAYLKALGEGLTRPLPSFDVSLAPGHAPRLLRVEGDPQAPFRWTLRSLEPAPNYVGALAAEGAGWRLACWRWDDPADCP
ncbi:MAG: 4'-phosphopantetheinyl transferase superfamily protein [Candidatus Rokubacteria bacterium]|nr:4'-phosphopantetheinyl transferase superfamily protein [Candidatus Rokubacteria bacterium]